MQQYKNRYERKEKTSQVLFREFKTKNFDFILMSLKCKHDLKLTTKVGN